MKKLIALLQSSREAEFIETYEYYEPCLKSITDTVCSLRSPSGKLSCAAFVGGNGHFYGLKASLHAQDAPFRSLNYDDLRCFLKTQGPQFPFDQFKFETVGRYLEANNCAFIQLFEGEENPILIRVQLGGDFPFPIIKKPLEDWLQSIPSMVQSEVRFQKKSYFAQENKYALNPLICAASAANERIDCIHLIVSGLIDGAECLLPYDLSYGISVNQVLYIPVIRSGNVEMLHTQIVQDSSFIKYGSIQGSSAMNYVLVEGALLPGDSGAPAIIEKHGKLF